MMIQNDTDPKIIVVANKTFVLNYDLSSCMVCYDSWNMRNVSQVAIDI